MYTRKFTIFILVFVLILMVGCVEGDAPAAPNNAVWTGDHLHIKSECPTPEQCHFAVTIDGADIPKTLAIILEADYGILFQRGDFPGEPIALEKAGKVAASRDVYIEPTEARTAYFPYKLANQGVLAGEYVVTVTLLGAGGILRQKNIKAYVIQEEGVTKLTASQAAFDLLHTQNYTPGKIGASYLMHPEQTAHPIRGNVYVKVTASDDDYNINVNLHSNGGIKVAPPSNVFTVEINKGGSRILPFSFQMVKDGEYADGRYELSITITNRQLVQIHETLPIAAELVSEANTHQNQWVTVAIVAVTEATPYATAVFPGAHGGKGDENDIYSFDANVGNAVKKEDAAQSGDPNIGGGVPTKSSVIPMPTSFPEKSTPAAVTPSSSTGHIEIFPAPQPSADGVAQQMVDGRSAVYCPQSWTRPVRFYAGTLEEAYHDYVENKVVGMEDWERFLKWAEICNPHLIADNYILFSDQEYRFPDGSHP